MVPRDANKFATKAMDLRFAFAGLRRFAAANLAFADRAKTLPQDVGTGIFSAIPRTETFQMQEVQALAFRLALPKGVPKDVRVAESERIHFFESRFLDESQLIHSVEYTNMYGCMA